MGCIELQGELQGLGSKFLKRGLPRGLCMGDYCRAY